MKRAPIERLGLSIRTTNLLHRIGVHRVDELLERGMYDLLNGRGFGKNAIAEIRCAMSDFNGKCFKNEFSEEQLCEMEAHSVSELNLSSSTCSTLKQMGYTTIDKLAVFTSEDFDRVNWLDGKSIIEMKEKLAVWIEKGRYGKYQNYRKYIKDNDECKCEKYNFSEDALNAMSNH